EACGLQVGAARGSNEGRLPEGIAQGGRVAAPGRGQGVEGGEAEGRVAEVDARVGAVVQPAAEEVAARRVVQGGGAAGFGVSGDGRETADEGLQAADGQQAQARRGDEGGAAGRVHQRGAVAAAGGDGVERPEAGDRIDVARARQVARGQVGDQGVVA